MGAGRPVRQRTSGFDADVTSLGRLRTVLKMQPGLDREKVANAVRNIDALMETLVEITADIKAA
jgi:hypothetical protein